MVKVARTYTIDMDLVQKLDENKQINASALLSKLLKDYFESHLSEDPQFLERKRDELQDDIDIKKKKVEQITNRLIEISQKGKNEEANKEYVKAYKLYKAKVDELNQLWYSEKIDEKEYWKRMDELTPTKPKVEDFA